MLKRLISLIRIKNYQSQSGTRTLFMLIETKFKGLIRKMIKRKNTFTLKNVCPQHTVAFTLIELLTVVAIIGVLAAMLLPALQQAREKTKQIVCGSNLRQCGLAFMMYVQDYGEFFPPLNYGTEPRWTNILADYREYEPAIGPHGGYIQREMLVCPSHRNAIGYHPYHSSYAVSAYFLQTPPAKRKLSQVKRPSQTLLLVDAEDISSADILGNYLIVPNWISGTVGIPDDRHNGCANILWVDGHVSSHPIQDASNPYASDPFDDSTNSKIDFFYP